MTDDQAPPAEAAFVALSDEVLLRHVAGEAVLLHLSTGTYYGLEPIGTRMLTLALEHAGTDAIVAALGAEYDAAPDRLAQDLETLMADLATAGLVVRRAAG